MQSKETGNTVGENKNRNMDITSMRLKHEEEHCIKHDAIIPPSIHMCISHSNYCAPTYCFKCVRNNETITAV